MYDASLSGHFIPAFMAAAALAFVLTKFLNSSDYSSFDFAFYNESFLIAEAVLLREASCYSYYCFCSCSLRMTKVVWLSQGM